MRIRDRNPAKKFELFVFQEPPERHKRELKTSMLVQLLIQPGLSVSPKSLGGALRNPQNVR